MDINITIGIPVYNAAEYIEKAITSVLNQTIDNFEILIVDDRGSDHSMEIVNQIKESHPRGKMIKIVKHPRNLGVANARNTIIREALGKYLFFMDSDDYLNPNSLELLYKKAEETQAETVWGSSQAVWAMSGECNPHFLYPDLELFGEDKLVLFDCQDLRQRLAYSIWNILFNLNFIRSNHLEFEEHGGYDDAIFQAKMQPFVKRAVLISNLTYNYYQRPNSLSAFQYRDKYDIHEATDAIEASEIIIAVCKKLYKKPYYDALCIKVMRQAYFLMTGILKHREQMNGKIDNRRLKQWFKHPAQFRQIIKFKRYRKENLAIWIIGRLPANLMVLILTIISKIKNHI